MESTAITASFLYRELTACLKKQPEVKQSILAHIKARSGCDTLEALAKSPHSDSEKSRPMAECLRAMLKNDYSCLVGGPPLVEPVKPVQVKPESPTTVTAPIPQVVSVSAPIPAVHEKPDAVKRVEEIVRRVLAEEAPKLVQATIKSAFHKTEYELLAVMQRAYDRHRKKLAKAIEDTE